MSDHALGTDFTRGNITGLLLRFLTPLLLASLLNSLYNIIDMIIIGLYVGSAGTVAVSQGGKLLQVLTLVSAGLAGGGEILISQQVGAGRRDEVRRTIGTLFTLLAAVSVVLAALCLLLSDRIVLWLNTPEPSYAQSLSYLRITSGGLPLLFIYTAVGSVLRGMGDSRNPLIFIAIAAGVNLILDLVLIIRFDMQAAGTAWATVAGQGVSCVLAVIFLYRKREQFSFDFKPNSFQIDRGKLRIILGIGVPLAMQSALVQIAQLFMIGYINGYGLVQAAAYGIGDKINWLTNIVTQCVKQAAGAMVGQNVGAGRQDRAKQVVRTSLLLGLGVAVVLSAFCLLFPRALFSLFTKDEAVMAYCRPFMNIMALIYFFNAGTSAYSAVVSGTGNARLALLSGVLDGIVLRVGFSVLFGIALDMQVTGFFLANALARLGALSVGCAYYFSGAWKRRRILVDRTDMTS